MTEGITRRSVLLSGVGLAATSCALALPLPAYTAEDPAIAAAAEWHGAFEALLRGEEFAESDMVHADHMLAQIRPTTRAGAEAVFGCVLAARNGPWARCWNLAHRAEIFNGMAPFLTGRAA